MTDRQNQSIRLQIAGLSWNICRLTIRRTWKKWLHHLDEKKEEGERLLWPSRSRVWIWKRYRWCRSCCNQQQLQKFRKYSTHVCCGSNAFFLILLARLWCCCCYWLTHKTSLLGLAVSVECLKEVKWKGRKTHLVFEGWAKNSRRKEEEMWTEIASGREEETKIKVSAKKRAANQMQKRGKNRKW